MTTTNDHWQIFVIDDETGVLRTVSRVLECEDYTVSAFASGVAALAEAARLHPDLAIIDIRMPDRDGFSIMEELKQISPSTEVILMTGSVQESDQSLIRAISHNAFYFITKPFDRKVLLALVERCLELKRLAAVNLAHLENMRRQLLSAMALQKTMLPPPEYRFADYLISAKYLPCDELAGDYFDYAANGDSSISVLIADVVGHGASAAMLTSVVKSAFHRSRSDGYDPSTVVARLSEDLSSFAADQYATVLCAKLFPSRNELCFVNAGHTGGLLIGPDGTTQSLDTTCALVSSAFPDPEPNPITTDWHSGDSLLLYTDGVSEAWGTSGMFGEDRLMETVLKAASAHQSLSDAVAAAVTHHIGVSVPSDDVTVLSLQEAED